MDIRSRPKSEWRRLLRESWPRPMDEGLGWTPEEGSAVIGVIIVMRMIISYTDDIFRSVEEDPETAGAKQAAEEQNVLLKYAWHDTSDAVDKATVLRLQEEVYNELMNPEGQWVRSVSDGVTFDGIVESIPMWRHFWSRPELSRWVGFEVEEKDGWTPLEPVLKGDGTKVSPTMLAKQSLVTWCSDDMTLEERLTLPHTRIDGEQQGRRLRHVQRWCLGSLRCLRVSYDPGKEADLTGFRDLVRLSVIPEEVEVRRGEARWVEGSELSYRLVAVVKLGSPAHIRTYDKAGHYLVPRAVSSRDFVCLSNDWELGQPGAKYMLYYVLASPGDPREVPAGLETGHESAVDLLQLSSIRRTRESPLPDDTPTAPRADRERVSQSAPREFAKRSSVNTIPLGRHRQLGGEALVNPAGDRGDSPRASQGPGEPAIQLPLARRRAGSPDPAAPRPAPPAPRAPPVRFSPPRRWRPHSSDPPAPLPAPPAPPMQDPPRRRATSPDDDSQGAEASGIPREGAKPSSIWARSSTDFVARKRRRPDDNTG